MAAVAAARACPESMSRSEPASTAGTGQWVSRWELECSCEEGGKQTERATQSKAVTHRHFGTREGCCRAAMRAGGKDACKGVCASQTWSEQVPKGLWVLWSTTHLVMSLRFCHPALLLQACGTGHWEQGIEGNVLCDLGTVREEQDIIPYLAWKVASPVGSGAGMASAGCRENRCR